MADDILLTQNIQMLTSALTALNQNMFNHTGGRSAIWGANTAVPGTSTTRGGTDDKNTIKAIATNTLLNATMKSNTDTVKYLIKDSKKNMQDLGKYTQMSAMYFKTAIKDFSVKQLDDVLPKKLNSYLEAHIKNGIVPQLKSFEDVVKLQKRANLQNIDAALKLTHEYGAATTSLARQRQIRDTIEQQTGFSFNELGEAARDNGKALKENAGEISKGMASFAANMHQAEQNWAKLKKAGELLMAAATVLGVDLYKTAVAAQKYGTEVTLATIKQAAYAGMTGEELIKVQNENIQAIYSSKTSFDKFNQSLEDGAERLLPFTGSLKDGALLTANVFGTFRKLSSHGEELAGFQANQESTFKRMNRTLGVTAEQFGEMNDELTNNNAVQAQMYKVGSIQRVNLLKGMQLQVEQLALDGLTVEQSKKLVESLAEITGGKAKERYTEAARIQGVLGALGLGKQGQEAADIIRKGQRASPEELKRLADIQVEAQRSVSSKYANGGRAMEFQLDALTDVIGKFLGPSSPGAQAATSQGKQIDAQTAYAAQQKRALDGLTSVGQTQILWAERQVQAVNAGFSGVLPVVKGILGFLLAEKGVGFLKNLFKFGRGAGGAGGLLGEGALLGEGGLAAGGAAAAGGITLGGAALAGIVGAITGGITYLLTDTVPKAFGAKQGLGEWLGGKIYDMVHPNGGIDPQQSFTTDQYKKQIQQDQADVKELEAGNQDENTATQIASLLEEIKKLTDLQKKHLEATQKLTQVTQQGINQQAAQTDDHINVTKKIVEERDTRRAPSIQ